MTSQKLLGGPTGWRLCHGRTRIAAFVNGRETTIGDWLPSIDVGCALQVGQPEKFYRRYLSALAEEKQP